MSKSEIVYDIVIVGAGAGGTAVLSQLSTRVTDRRILIVEKMDVMGSGFVYCRENMYPYHHANLPAGLVDIVTSDLPDPLNSDFMKWLKDDQKLENVSPSHYFPRVLIGKYLEGRSQDFLETTQVNGNVVETRLRTEAVSIKNVGGMARIGLSDGTFVESPVAILTTGHWFLPSKNADRGLFESPWPAKLLSQKIPPNSRVAILGTSLSAIDGSITLAYNVGHFEEIKDETAGDGKRQKFVTPHKDFRITMYSRGGRLPEVLGDVIHCPTTMIHPDDAEKEKMGDFIRENIDIAVSQGPDGLLDTLMTMMLTDIIKIQPDLAPLAGLSLEAIMAKLKDDHEGVSRKDELIKNIKRARESIRTRIPLQPQTLMYHYDTLIGYVYQYLNEKDRRRFQQAHTYVANLSNPFPLETAEKILALMDAGRLEIVAMGDDYEMKEVDQGVVLKFSGKEVHEPYLIKALGQSSDMSKDPSRLTQSLLREGLAEELILDGFKAGGLVQDAKTYRLLSKSDGPQPLIFGMSPPMTSNHSDLQGGLTSLPDAADRVVSYIVSLQVPKLEAVADVEIPTSSPKSSAACL